MCRPTQSSKLEYRKMVVLFGNSPVQSVILLKQPELLPVSNSSVLGNQSSDQKSSVEAKLLIESANPPNTFDVYGVKHFLSQHSWVLGKGTGPGLFRCSSGRTVPETLPVL